MRLYRFRRLALVPAAVLVAPLLVVWTATGQAQVSGVQSPTLGQQVYQEICQACHMADARGGGSAGAMIPSLADNPKLAEKDYGVTLLLKGRGEMPSFTDMLTKPQIAAVLTYVRSHYNDYPDPVTVADIDRVATGPPPQ